MESADLPRFKYAVNIDHLINLTFEDLSIWRDNFLKLTDKSYPLDLLYKLKGVSNEFR